MQAGEEKLKQSRAERRHEKMLENKYRRYVHKYRRYSKQSVGWTHAAETATSGHEIWRHCEKRWETFLAQPVHYSKFVLRSLKRAQKLEPRHTERR